MKKILSTLLLVLALAVFSTSVLAQQYNCNSITATPIYGGGQYHVVIVDASSANTVPVALQLVTSVTAATVASITASTVTLWLSAGTAAIFETGSEAIYCLTTSGTAQVGVTVRLKQNF